MKVVTRIGVVCCAVVMSVVIGAGSATAIPLPVLPPLPEPFATWFKPPEPLDKKLAKSYAALTKSMRKSLPGQLGVAIVPVGGDEVIALGSLKSGRAWSTMKVPVSLAAQRERGPGGRRDGGQGDHVLRQRRGR